MYSSRITTTQSHRTSSPCFFGRHGSATSSMNQKTKQNETKRNKNQSRRVARSVCESRYFQLAPPVRCLPFARPCRSLSSLFIIDISDETGHERKRRRRRRRCRRRRSSKENADGIRRSDNCRNAIRRRRRRRFDSNIRTEHNLPLPLSTRNLRGEQNTSI